MIPCFDEAQRLVPSEVAALARTPGLRVVLVDDGSADATQDVLEEIRRASDGRASWIALPRRSGKGEAVRQGLLAAIAQVPDAAFLGYLDADLSTPRVEALRLVREAQESGAAVVMGARVALLGRRIVRNPARHLLGRIFATGASIAMHLHVYDTQCGAKLFRRTPGFDAALTDPFLSRWAFDVELLSRLRYGWRGAPATPVEAFLEVPLREWTDVPGSKLRLHHFLRTAIDLVRIARVVESRRREIARARARPARPAGLAVAGHSAPPSRR